MTDPGYRITPQWKDLVVYDEGEGRKLEFDAGIMIERMQLSVPMASRWQLDTPAWAHDRRDEVVGRIRDAGFIVEEFADNCRRIFSPDGSFHVEFWREDDHPAPPLTSVRIVETPGNETLLNLTYAEQRGIVSFPGRGMVTLPFVHNNQHYQLGVNVPARTFQFHADEAAMSLSELAARLNPPLPPPASLATRRIGPVIQLIICLVFVVAGIWMAFVRHSVKDRWIGAMASLFFAACAVAPLSDLRSKPGNRQR
jgi:hypothetical protein